MSDLTSSLAQADIFDQLTDTQLAMISTCCEERTYAVEEIIFEEGTDSSELYIIAQGEVDILVNPAIVGKPSDTSKGLVSIATLHRGQSFGEIGLVDAGRRSATVRAARRDTRLIAISRDKLMRLCESDPLLGYRLMYNLAADMAMKIRNTDLRVRETLLYAKRPETGK